MRNLRGYDFLKGQFGIHYTPIFKTICKNNTNAGLLLSQMCYFANITENHFYKFSKPCENRFYQNGDSWCELLCFSEKELRNAMQILKELNFINSKRSGDFDNRTFYSVNFENIAEAITNILNNTPINEQKQPLKAKTEPKECKDTTEQEKTLKTQGKATIAKNATVEKNPVIAKNATSDLNLPKFIDKDIFQDFINHRKELKKPMTENAKKLLIKKLENFHLKGYNCNEILNTSILNGWLGVFEPKQNRPTSKSQSVANAVNDFLADDDYSNAEVLL